MYLIFKFHVENFMRISFALKNTTSGPEKGVQMVSNPAQFHNTHGPVSQKWVIGFLIIYALDSSFPTLEGNKILVGPFSSNRYVCMWNRSGSKTIRTPDPGPEVVLLVMFSILKLRHSDCLVKSSICDCVQNSV